MHLFLIDFKIDLFSTKIAFRILLYYNTLNTLEIYEYKRI